MTAIDSDPGSAERVPGERRDLAERVAELSFQHARIRNILAELANQVAVVEDHVAACFEARARSAADRAPQLLERAEDARRYAVTERRRAADYRQPEGRAPGPMSSVTPGGH